MAYDIYSNNLRPGYCEVHPRIHERYPCSLCLMEKELQKAREVAREIALQMDRRIKSLEYQAELRRRDYLVTPTT